ncbi:hypothetical protein GCM10009557_94220 [Virgisporangium ochraceum]|uniref:Uncharacterized protein n=1 Tax=Virgisporangium ochraceum TaxID=65505 RepID=A0A8J4A799_9ACTN|nr:hypothetical protein Voc01_101120 [Virgisporangium ochraceum]
MTFSRPLRVRLVAAALIVLCAGMFLYGVRRGAYQATRDGLQYVSIGNSDNRVVIRYRVDQIREEFADRIPAGSRIRIVAPSEFGTFWHIWLSEFATMNSVRVAEPAEFTVAVIEDGSGPHGVRLVVERVP